MTCYVSSKENRFYTVLEQGFGLVSSVTESNRVPALKLAASQRVEQVQRRDKTGSRTHTGLPEGLRKQTSYELSTYMTSWALSDAEPSYGPLIQAGLGGTPLSFAGGTVESINGTELRLTAPHNLTAGQGVSCGGELRFVAAVMDAQTILLNAPLTADQSAGWPVDRAVTYRPSSSLPSASIYDYWSPDSSVHRILAGAAVDRIKVDVNGDFHSFSFSGYAQDLVDSASFVAGQAGMVEFPAEPAYTGMAYSLVPGNLGQAWLGNLPEQFFTITSAEIIIDNNLEMRGREFGMETPRCVVPGMRSVSANFSLYEKPDATTKTLYQAARQRSPISVMFQLGQQPSQLCGVYLMSVVPEVPEFIDDSAQLEWRFQNCRAQGTGDDEIFIAFG